MKRTAVTLALILLPLLLSAQGIGDRELRRLVEDVRLLRSADESVYEDVFRRMEADLSWTPMNETGPLQSSECPPSERIGRFKLNRILSRADAGRKYVSAHGNMLNGEEARPSSWSLSNPAMPCRPYWKLKEWSPFLSSLMETCL